MKRQGKLLRSLQRVQPNKQYVDSRNDLQDALQKGVKAIFDNPNENIKTMDNSFKNYLKDIKKDNQRILKELLDDIFLKFNLILFLLDFFC